MDQQVTLRHWVMQNMRSGHLDRLEKPVVRRLFAEIPLSQLRKFLAYFSVTKTSSLSQKKAMEMCFSRFYRGSESSRQHALEIFQSCRGCVDYLDQPLQIVRDAISSEVKEVQLLGSNADGSFSSAKPDLSFSADEMNGSLNRTLDNDANDITIDLSSLEGVRLLSDLTVPQETVSASSQQSDEPSLWIGKFSTVVDKEGRRSVTCKVGDLVEKIWDSKKKVPVSSRPSPFVVPEDAPCILGLAQPAFYQIKSCLVNFTVPATSFGETNSCALSFVTPDMDQSDRVLLCFRSVGSLRDNRQADHPVGLEYSLNGGERKILSQKPQSLTSKLWVKKATVFDAPLELSVISNATNRLEFTFPSIPESVRYCTQYQGYVFLASARSLDSLTDKIQGTPADATTELVLSSLLGPNKDIEPLHKISLSLTCPITYTKMKVPCRGSKCRHPTCFEAANYLQMHQQAGEPRWKCAVCKEIVHWHNLRSDELMRYLIEKFPECDKVDAQLQDDLLSFHGVPVEPDVDDEEEGMD